MLTMERLCPCGSTLTSKQKKYCGKTCFYKYRVRPSGLKYNITKPNPGWFPAGVHSNPAAGFKKGSRPANFLGHDGKYAYTNQHKWVRYHKGKAIACEDCGANDRHCHWANVSHEYHYDLDDWISLCVPCHKKFDADSVGSLERVFRCDAW